MVGPGIKKKNCGYVKSIGENWSTRQLEFSFGNFFFYQNVSLFLENSHSDKRSPQKCSNNTRVGAKSIGYWVNY